MAQKYSNGQLAKIGDKVAGKDWFHQDVTGQIVAGDKAKGQPELVFQHGKHGHVCPSLRLHNFLPINDDAAGGSNPKPALASTPAPKAAT